MLKTFDASGKTEEEAIAFALAEVGKDRDEVSVEVLERAKQGFLGIGSSPAKIRISYEFIESDVEKTEEFLRGLLKHMSSDAIPVVELKDEDTMVVNLTGEKLGMLIGRRGETLDAIQHLTSYVVNKDRQKRLHISVDAEAYRSKREDSLRHLAEKVAAKVIKYRRNMTLEPMNSYERHVIHTALQDFEGVSTFSTGTEPNRRVVVAYGKAKREFSRNNNGRL
ncbi:MAG: protein jag [Clostridiales bacterium]|nr:protein jag [Clostridiales bacterium]